LDLTGKRYEASVNGATYSVWVLTTPGDSTQQRADPDRYLDASAQLIWEGLLKAARDKLPDRRRATAAMSYTKDLTGKTLPGREYSVTIGGRTGTTQFYVAESRIYVLLAMNIIGAEWIREPFFASFTVSPNVPGRLSFQTETKIPASNDLHDSTSIFKSSEVTQRARLLDKPEPNYTEDARMFEIQGTVILRAVFSANGEVTNINVIRKLPHGLTQRAVEAARRIRFIPAMKDGHPVSMWMQLEYNFNLY
jgi:TonB family protein